MIISAEASFNLNYLMPKLLFVYDHFFPAYKAGGPIQSLANLAGCLQDEYEVSVFTGSTDHNSTEKLKDIDADEWSAVALPGTGKNLQVWYASAGTITRKLFRRIVCWMQYLLLFT